MEARRDVFQAIADPTRREILGMIARTPTNVNAIAEQFDVSRQAISLHLKILAECGLLEVKKEGRERICFARMDQLREVNEWVSQYKSFWSKKLEALEAYLQTTTSTSSKHHEKTNRKTRKKR